MLLLSWEYIERRQGMKQGDLLGGHIIIPIKWDVGLGQNANSRGSEKWVEHAEKFWVV